MSLSKIFEDILTENTSFITLRNKEVQIAIYQKLLFKAGEGDEKAIRVLAAVDAIESSLDPAVQEGIKVERQRYAVAKANAVYQNYLQQKAMQKASAEQDNVLFDPQGRLIYELGLTDTEREEVLQRIEAVLAKSNPKAEQKKEHEHPELTLIAEEQGEKLLRSPREVNAALKKMLGRTPTYSTLCSIDLVNHPQLNKRYELIYGENQIASHQRASVLASFEEAYAHLGLMARTYEQVAAKLKSTEIDPQQWQSIRQKAASKLQIEVAQVYRQAVAEATRNGLVDIEKLNKKLAKARFLLAHVAKKELMKGLVAHLKDQGKGRAEVLIYMQKLCQCMDKDHTFTAQTATGYDYFYTSDYLQQGIHITGTQDTAHNKPQFKGQEVEDQLAFRRVTYTYQDAQGTLQASTAVSARIPSPALVFNGMSNQEIRADLVNKFGFLHEEMRAMRGGKNGPLVENLFTSFHTNPIQKLGDRSNRQTATAHCMIQAMHDFNAKQYHAESPGGKETDVPKNNFLYVQNIGTNRHTRSLGYQTLFTGSAWLDDITLSSEMAMLYTLQENAVYLSPKIKNQLARINSKVMYYYKLYLSIPEHRPSYFSSTPCAQVLISEIKSFKADLRLALNEQATAEDDLPALASHALARMLASNQHWDKRYGQLSQTLSMYIEWASTGGCKSGNERNQDVMLRFALLKSIHERVAHAGNTKGLQPHEEAIYEQLKHYVSANTADPDALRAALAVSVRECNLNGGLAAISREDQGGAAKVSSLSFVQDIKSSFWRYAVRMGIVLAAIPGIPLLALSLQFRTIGKVLHVLDSLANTNNAADREMHLDATGASKTQAHKGQDANTRKAVLLVLAEDELFQDKQGKLTKKEKKKFEYSAYLMSVVHAPEQTSQDAALDPCSRLGARRASAPLRIEETAPMHSPGVPAYKRSNRESMLAQPLLDVSRRGSLNS